jgi:hypothetical protein
MFNKGTFCSPEFVTFNTKCTFVEHSPGIISPEIFGKCYKLRASKCTLVEHSSGIISPGSFCKMLQTEGYKMYLC